MSGLDPEPRRLVELDLRSLPEAGSEGWERVRGALERLPGDGVLMLAAADRPAQILTRLEERGYRVSVREAARDLWSVTARAPGAPELAELDDLPAPEPLERVLEATARLAAGEAFLARVPRYPRLLLPRLQERGLDVEAREEPEGTALVHVRRPA
jgi:hypothetical protein